MNLSQIISRNLMRFKSFGVRIIVGYWELGFVISCFLLLTVPVIEFGKAGGYDYDESKYHIPTIQNILRTWPVMDLNRDTVSAVAPGYHYFLASVSQLTGSGLRTLRWVNLIVSLGIPLVLVLYGRRFIPGWRICLLVLPLVTSNFIIKSACWVVTDNASLLLVSLSLIALLLPRPEAGQSFLIGSLAMGATCARQLQAWLLLPMTVRTGFVIFEKRKPWVIIASICGLIFPLLVLAKLYLVWGGLVPPIWKGASVKFSLCPIAYLLSVFAFFGFFFLPVDGDWEKMQSWLKDKLLWGSMLLGFVIALLTPTSYSYEDGRWGGYLWAAAQKLPVFSGRAVFFTVTAPLGAAVIIIMWRAMQEIGRQREAFLWLSAVIGWTVSFVINRQVFQRYYEPMTLVFLILATILICQKGSPKISKCFAIRLFVLTLIQAVITFATVYRVTLEGSLD